MHEHLERVDGVMVGREAYHNPWWLASWDAAFFGEPPTGAARAKRSRQQMCDYMAREAAAHGTPWSTIARHMLGLRNGLPGARRWRQVWSDHRLKDLPPREVMALAHRRRVGRGRLTRAGHGRRPVIGRPNALNLNNLGWSELHEHRLHRRRARRACTSRC